GNGGILLDKNGKQISPEGKYYGNFNFNYFAETGMIVSSEKGKGEVLLDKNGKQVSPEGKYYNYFNFNYFAETGMIVSSEKGKGKGEVLLDKNGKQVSPEGEYYDDIKYHAAKNKFYYDSLFFRKYIDLDNNSGDIYYDED
ncbi:MAG: hypothetical protein PHI37_04105, partial [Candidatus Gracilibacteria bacterium]|nr:hypothetical protein [Candidatus Gracilibacteria bacterium]